MEKLKKGRLGKETDTWRLRYYKARTLTRVMFNYDKSQERMDTKHKVINRNCKLTKHSTHSIYIDVDACLDEGIVKMQATFQTETE